MKISKDQTEEQIKAQIARPASCAIVGGFRPPDDPLTSWFGSVQVALPGETWPEWAGKPMMPLCQFNLTELPFRPDVLSDLALITVFINQDELPIDTPNGEGWLLRAYPHLEGLERLAAPDDCGGLKPFPIRWELITEDFPSWEDVSGQDWPQELDENYHDHFENQHCTKVGGWPSVIQAGLGMATTQEDLDYAATADGKFDCPFYVFQLDTEDKSHWMWGDSGTGYIGRGTGTGRDTWTLEWQCY